MPDLKSVRAVALDIADVNASYERQDDVAEFVWRLLERNYQIYLCCTNKNEDLAEEDFQHPRLVFLRGEMPPGEELLQRHADLMLPTTLWISEERQMLDWLRQNGLFYATTGSVARDFAEGLRFGRLSELTTLLHPTAFVLDHIVEIVQEHRRFNPGRPLVVGIGGPPQSGYQQFAIDLRGRLQTSGVDLAELMDLSSLLLTSDAVQSGQSGSGVWSTAEAGRWLVEDVLQPLQAGQRVYVERRPADVPQDFDAHFPLFISEESVLLAFGEMPFTPPLVELLHLSVLLEVSADETTRRLYEIPEEQEFDPKFTHQFLAHEGRVYWDYLRTHHVAERASIRVDANHEHAFYLQAPEDGPLA